MKKVYLLLLPFFLMASKCTNVSENYDYRYDETADLCFIFSDEGSPRGCIPCTDDMRKNAERIEHIYSIDTRTGYCTAERVGTVGNKKSISGCVPCKDEVLERVDPELLEELTKNGQSPVTEFIIK